MLILEVCETALVGKKQVADEMRPPVTFSLSTVGRWPDANFDVTVGVFLGRAGQGQRQVGVLTMKVDEWNELASLVRENPDGDRFHIRVEEFSNLLANSLRLRDQSPEQMVSTAQFAGELAVLCMLIRAWIGRRMVDGAR